MFLPENGQDNILHFMIQLSFFFFFDNKLVGVVLVINTSRFFFFDNKLVGVLLVINTVHFFFFTIKFLILKI